MEIGIEVNSSIGKDSVFTGRFAVRGNLRIDGKFEGHVLMVDQLEIGPNARIKTNIHATSVIIKGVVIGDISAARRILLLSTARVLGHIRTPELIIQEGVILEGKCTISHAQINNTQEYIKELYEQTEEV